MIAIAEIPIVKIIPPIKLHPSNCRVDFFSILQVTLLKFGAKSVPKLISENFKNERLEAGCLAGSNF